MKEKGEELSTPLLHKDAIEVTEYHRKRSVFQHFDHIFYRSPIG
jgi:hypothetical protein